MSMKVARIASVAFALSFFGIIAEKHACAELIVSNFAFGSGTPFGGTTTLAGVDVTLVTTNTEPFGGTAFRDTLAAVPADVTFTFSQPIGEFILDVSRVHPEEFLGSFNIGAPTSLTGTLINLGGVITTSGTNDFGFGRLGWTGLNTTVVSFTISNFPNPRQPSGPALAVNQFGFNANVPAVIPEPASMAILGTGLLPIAFVLLRRARAANGRADHLAIRSRG